MKKAWQHWSGWNMISAFLILFFCIFVFLFADYYAEQYQIDRSSVIVKTKK